MSDKTGLNEERPNRTLMTDPRPALVQRGAVPGADGGTGQAIGGASVKAATGGETDKAVSGTGETDSDIDTGAETDDSSQAITGGTANAAAGGTANVATAKTGDDNNAATGNNGGGGQLVQVSTENGQLKVTPVGGSKANGTGAAGSSQGKISASALAQLLQQSSKQSGKKTQQGTTVQVSAKDGKTKATGQNKAKGKSQGTE